jgi:hypothetical protein
VTPALQAHRDGSPWGDPERKLRITFGSVQHRCQAGNASNPCIIVEIDECAEALRSLTFR